MPLGTATKIRKRKASPNKAAKHYKTHNKFFENYLFCRFPLKKQQIKTEKSGLTRRAV
jgi:hypothetical protein